LDITGGGGSGAPAPINLNSGSCPADIVRGQHSDCVTELRSLLNHHGAELAVDGDFGPLTEAAVRDFQAEKGLLVDGIVGPQTKGALYGVVAPRRGGPMAWRGDRTYRVTWFSGRPSVVGRLMQRGGERVSLGRQPAQWLLRQRAEHLRTTAPSGDRRERCASR
jgi:hypothetical protein